MMERQFQNATLRFAAFYLLFSLVNELINNFSNVEVSRTGIPILLALFLTVDKLCQSLNRGMTKEERKWLRWKLLLIAIVIDLIWVSVVLMSFLWSIDFREGGASFFVYGFYGAIALEAVIYYFLIMLCIWYFNRRATNNLATSAATSDEKWQ